MSRQNGFFAIISAKSDAVRRSKLDEIIELQFKQSNYQIVILNQEEKASIGITETRDLILKINHSSLVQGNRVYLIKDSDKLTIPAQNALLKILEEIPEGTGVIFETKNLDALLPTIISRATVYQVTHISDQENQEDEKFILELSGLNLAELFTLADKYGTDKQSTLRVLFLLLTKVKSFLEESKNLEMGISINKCSNYADFILQCIDWVEQTNVQSRLILENCFIGYYSIFKSG